jgi:hypothetical protein
LSALINEIIPAACGAAKLVPVLYDASRPLSNPFTLIAMIALNESPPGADTEILFPQLLYAASFPSLVLAETDITSLQLAGKYPETFWLLFPAAAMTIASNAVAWFTADWR